jgi:hypothetical protein
MIQKTADDANIALAFIGAPFDKLRAGFRRGGCAAGSRRGVGTTLLFNSPIFVARKPS